MSFPNVELIFDSHPTKGVAWSTRDHQEKAYEEAFQVFSYFNKNSSEDSVQARCAKYLTILTPRDEPHTYEEAVEHAINRSFAICVYTTLNVIIVGEIRRSFHATHGPHGRYPGGDTWAELYIDINEDTAAAELDLLEASEISRVVQIIKANQSDKNPGTSRVEETSA